MRCRKQFPTTINNNQQRCHFNQIDPALCSPLILSFCGVHGKILNIVEFLLNKLNKVRNTMDVESFLLTSGFALLIVLLGWANQITSKSKETKDIEGEFLKKAKLKRKDYKKIIKEQGATEDSFSALVDFLYTKKEEDVEIFEKIKNVKTDLETLDKKYSRRFWILLYMSVSLFITGIVSFFLPTGHKFLILFPNLIFIVAIFCNLVKVHNLEKRYTKNISEAMEKL